MYTVFLFTARKDNIMDFLSCVARKLFRLLVSTWTNVGVTWIRRWDVSVCLYMQSVWVCLVCVCVQTGT